MRQVRYLLDRNVLGLYWALENSYWITDVDCRMLRKWVPKVRTGKTERTSTIVWHVVARKIQKASAKHDGHAVRKIADIKS